MLLNNELVVKINGKYHTLVNVIQARDLINNLMENFRKERKGFGRHKTELWEISGAYSMESDKSLLTPINRLKANKVGEVITSQLSFIVGNSTVKRMFDGESFDMELQLDLREILNGEEEVKWYTGSI